jgi:hypothetical protein
VDIPRCLSSDDAIRVAVQLGVRVLKPNRTGEYRFIFPDGRQHLMNARRKDCSKKVLSMLRQLARQFEPTDRG